MSDQENEGWRLSEEQYKKLISHDRGAWQEFVKSKTPLLMSYIQWKFQCSKGNAEEITVDVFEEVLNCLPNLQQLSKFKWWILQIAFRTARKKFKEPAGGPLPIEDHVCSTKDFEPWEYIAAQELRLWLAQHLNVLTPDQLSVFMLHFYEHLPNSEIADLMGKDVKIVNVQLAKARKHLREVYEKEHT
jgi:RNA polymerase sigma factor (sigma-70 family)